MSLERIVSLHVSLMFKSCFAEIGSEVQIRIMNLQPGFINRIKLPSLSLSLSLLFFYFFPFKNVTSRVFNYTYTV